MIIQSPFVVAVIEGTISNRKKKRTNRLRLYQPQRRRAPIIASDVVMILMSKVTKLFPRFPSHVRKLRVCVVFDQSGGVGDQGLAGATEGTA